MVDNFDYLVIGSGIAGLSYALRVAETGTVAIVTKKGDTDSSTNRAQGGIAAVMDSNDSFEEHIRDTLKTGCGLSHKDAVVVLVKEGPSRVIELFEMGVAFTFKGKEKKFHLGREGGHSVNRIVHAKDFTGQAVETVLVDACKAHPNIRFYENHHAIDLATINDDKECLGAAVLDSHDRTVREFRAKITLLCTGGIGKIYLHSTNPSIATGDGIAMAYRAGATLGNLEFMQFHPTTLYHPEANSFLISEAVRGYGGILKNKSGQRFMQRYHPDAELAPRDVVARAIDSEMKMHGDPCVYLDVSQFNAEELKNEFPLIYENCLKYKIDITKDPIPVVPAAHYICGGVITDLNGRTSIERLYATGEVAMTGVHGANRLASNSLLEAVVFSHRAAKHASDEIKKHASPEDFPSLYSGQVGYDKEEILIKHDMIEIQRLMWDYVGIVRSNMRLKRAHERVNIIAEDVETFYDTEPLTESLIELRNVATVSSLVVNCALNRKESRGLHFNIDYPESDDVNWMHDTLISRAGIQSGGLGMVH